MASTKGRQLAIFNDATYVQHGDDLFALRVKGISDRSDHRLLDRAKRKIVLDLSIAAFSRVPAKGDYCHVCLAGLLLCAGGVNRHLRNRR